METKATGVATTRILLSIADDLENNFWFHLVHGSQKKKQQSFCIRGHLSIPEI